MTRRRVVAAALLVGALVGPVGTGASAVEPDRSAGRSGVVRETGDTEVTLDPSPQRVAPGQEFTGTLTVENRSGTTLVDVEVRFNDMLGLPSWFTNYTCPAGWLDEDSGDATDPNAVCKFMDPGDIEGKDWPAGSSAVFPVTYKVPTTEQVGTTTTVGIGNVGLIKPTGTGNWGAQVTQSDFRIVDPSEVPLVDPWILAGAATALGVVIYVRRRQGRPGVRVAA